MKVVVVGGGIAGLAATRRLESLVPEGEVVLVEKEAKLGGKVVTDRVGGFVVEGAPDSFLSRKERGVGLCEELGLGPELIGRRPENARSFVRRRGELHVLPEGLTGMIPTSLDGLRSTRLLSEAGRERLEAEIDLPAAPPGEDESIASFVSRRLGEEAYENLVEPLMTGIYGGDGGQLSLQATFPELRGLELEHGSVIRGLLAQSSGRVDSRPPFLTLRSGMDTLVRKLAQSLERTRILTGRSALGVRERPDGFAVVLDHDDVLHAEGVIVAAPAFAVADLLAELDPELAGAHAETPYASSAVVTLGYRAEDVSHPLDGYGYVVPRVEGSDVLACTWTSSKWESRSPEGHALIRVYAGRFGGRDVSEMTDDDLVGLAREELSLLDISAEPSFVRIHRWPGGIPQYVLGHRQRLERIEAGLERHPGLALAGAAYRGVGIPDCIRSGEEAAQLLARALERVPG